MEGIVVLAEQGERETCWYELHRNSNPGRSHASTMFYPKLTEKNATKLSGVLEFGLC